MPHIHTQPNQHDMTVSGYIVRVDDVEPRCLVHMHRKMGKLMQIGGHIELDQTPWQSMAQELKEESGYELGEVQVAQHSTERLDDATLVTHPTPFLVNTHSVGNNHFHSDLCYGFVALAPPLNQVAEGESEDSRWLTLSELDAAVESGEALSDMRNIYRLFVKTIGSYALVAATSFSLAKPAQAIATYKYGAPGQ